MTKFLGIENRSCVELVDMLNETCGHDQLTFLRANLFDLLGEAMLSKFLEPRKNVFCQPHPCVALRCACLVSTCYRGGRHRGGAFCTVDRLKSEVIEQITKMAKKGVLPSQIGVSLRDSFGVPKVPAAHFFPKHGQLCVCVLHPRRILIARRPDSSGTRLGSVQNVPRAQRETV